MPVEFNAELAFLFEPARYKVIHGGRGSGKSVGAARALLLLAAQKPLRILCARELQTSIRESVHRLLADQIDEMGLGSFYEVQQQAILGKNGSDFIFKGLRHNVSEIKSMQGIDICWIEEAQVVSKASWDVLIPTIRKDGSEIWITFNPELETDQTYQRFVVSPPPGAVVKRLNWSENPWFPEVLRVEKDALKERDPDAYLTVWEGHCRQTLEGAIFASEIRAATEQNRITRVPYDATVPVETFWDLGWADHTAIWFAQAVGFEYRIIDYYQDRQKPLQHYLGVLQSRGYVYGADWLPHDAQARQMGSGRSIEELMRTAGRNVRIVPRLDVADGINAARTIFGQCWFDTEKCADGLQCLRHYRYEVDPETKLFSRKPLHDEYSHGADAFRYLAVGLTRATTYDDSDDDDSGSGSWMSA